MSPDAGGTEQVTGATNGQGADDASQVPTVPVSELTVGMPSAAAWRDWSGFMQMLPGERSRLPPPLIASHEMPNLAWFTHVHGQQAEVPPLGCHLIRDAEITGHGYVFSAGRLVTQDVYLHDVARSEIAARPDLLPGSALARRCLRIDQPVIEILGPGSPVYGHWLVDFLPRAAIAREMLGEAFHECLIPLPRDLPDWTVDLLVRLTGFRPENALRYEPDAEFLSCARLCVPTFGHAARGYFFHSFVRDFYARFVPPRPAARTRRLCLSRRNFEHQTRGVLKGFAQRLHMEQAALRHGFEIVCPEVLSFDEQVALFAEAGIVLGEYGSALHNTLFSPARTIIGSVRYPNSVQTRIAGLMGQDVLYLIPDTEAVDDRGAEIYAVSVDKIDRFLDQLVGLHVESLVPGTAS